MTRAVPLLLAGALLLSPVIPGVAGDITLESGRTLTIAAVEYHRMLLHAFYDQAMASLPRLFPEHVFLAGRRSAALGEVVYSLVCFREAGSSERVLIQAVAVHGDRAWSLEAESSSRYGETLLRVLEEIGRLPARR